MKFQIGDKILIKTSGEEGELIGFINDKLVKVRVGGVEFPIEEIEIDHPYLSWFLNKKITYEVPIKKYIDDVPKEKVKANNNRYLEMGMHFLMLPVYKNLDDDILDKVKVYLINNYPLPFSFSYSYVPKQGDSFKINSEIGKWSEFYINDISYDDLANGPNFECSFAEIIDDIVSSITQENCIIKLKPKKLFELIENMHINNLPFFTIELFAPAEKLTETAEVINIKPWQPPVPKIVPKKPKDRVEAPILVIPKVDAPKQVFLPSFLQNPTIVDLHIQNLVGNSENLNNAEKINLQMQAFEKALDNALKTNQNRLFLIHGVGKGVLKNKIHQVLNQTKTVVSYVNEYSPKYGFGATEVFFGH